MKKCFILILLSLSILSCSRKAKDSIYTVKWNNNSLVPEAIITGGEGHSQTYHNVSWFRLKCYVYLDGTARFLSSEFGAQFFTKAPFHENFKWPLLITNNDTIKLDINALANKIETIQQHYSTLWFNSSKLYFERKN